jgi:NADH pyrophosphatase NudC (nudix superfamily)
MRTDFDQQWKDLATEILSGMKEWRLQHPRATLNEIEAALDERLGRLRARMLEDAALASAAADWSGEDEEPPLCPQCGQPMERYGGAPVRHLQTHGGQQLKLRRRYARCPSCGMEFFPPG